MERLRHFAENVGGSGVIRTAIIGIGIVMLLVATCSKGKMLFAFPATASCFVFAYMIRKILVHNATATKWIMNAIGASAIGFTIFGRSYIDSMEKDTSLIFILIFLAMYMSMYFWFMSDENIAVVDN